MHSEGQLPAAAASEGTGTVLPPIGRGSAVQCSQGMNKSAGGIASAAGSRLKADETAAAPVARTASKSSAADAAKLSGSVSTALRAELDRMARELTVLEDLEQRELEAQRLRDQRAAVEFDRAAKEKIEMERYRDAEMRKFIDEMHAERVARETSEALAKERTGSVKGQTSKIETEETLALRTTLKSQIGELYGQLDELMDSDYILKQKSREKEAAMRRRREDAEDERAARHALANSENSDVWVTRRTLRKDLDSLRQEAKELERASLLARRRQEALEEDLRAKREGEAQRQIEYMTMTRERAVAR
eukprot:RCo038439